MQAQQKNNHRDKAEYCEFVKRREDKLTTQFVASFLFPAHLFIAPIVYVFATFIFAFLCGY